MNLVELFITEDNRHVAFCFGRFNPPNAGHAVVFQTVAKAAGEGDWFIFTSQSQDKKKNPLTFQQKTNWLQKLHPDLKGHLVTDPAVKTYLQAAAYLYAKGYRSATFVAGTEDLAAMKVALEKYNGVESTHGMYDFRPLQFAESPSPEGRSTDARNAAVSNDLKKFMQITGISDEQTAHALMNDVQQGMGVTQQETMAGVGMLDNPERNATNEHIVKVKGGYELKSKKTGKNLGKYPTKAGAEKRERQVQYFKHAGESIDEAEGEPEGLPHLTKELLTHIIQQVGTEGAHAIVKSLQWGDGAAKELLQLIVKDLKNNISMSESVKQRLDPKCWKGKHKEGTKIKGGVRVNNCVANEASPNQQAALYNPIGTTYRGEKMPTLDNDPVDDAERFGPEHDEPYEQDFDKEKLKQLIAKHLDTLPKKYKMVMKLRYWSDMTLDEVSAVMGVSRERIRQIEAKALRNLRHYAKKDIGGFYENKQVEIGEGWEAEMSDAVNKLLENFADGKNPGRKGLAKRSGVNTKASVSDLRATAKHSTGEKARMAHWMANMKAGRAKK